MARCTPPQLSLFDTALHDRVERLTLRLDELAKENQHFFQAYQDAQQDLRGAWQQIHDLTTALALAREHEKLWRLLYELEHGHTPRPHHRLPDVDRLLMELTKLCHPDRWHNQPATALAHETMILINNVREQAGGGR